MKKRKFICWILLVLFFALLPDINYAIDPKKRKRAKPSSSHNNSEAELDRMNIDGETSGSEDDNPAPKKRSRKDNSTAVFMDDEAITENDIAEAVSSVPWSVFKKEWDKHFEKNEVPNMRDLKAFFEILKSYNSPKYFDGGFRGGLNGELAKRGMHNFENQRALQTLRQISTQLLAASAILGKQLKTKAVEIQAMYVDGKIFIACNNNKHLEMLQAEWKERGGKAMLTKEYLQNDADINELMKRIRAKIQIYYDNPAFYQEDDRAVSREIFRVLNENNVNTGSVEFRNKKWNPNESHKLADPGIMTNPFRDGKKSGVYFVYAPNDFHAEQKLGMVLENFGKNIQSVPVIAGQKRPCGGCWIYLTQLNEKISIEFADKHGKIYVKQILNGIKRIRNAESVSKYVHDVCKKTHIHNVFGSSYGSDSDSDESGNKRPGKGQSVSSSSFNIDQPKPKGKGKGKEKDRGKKGKD